MAVLLVEGFDTATATFLANQMGWSGSNITTTTGRIAGLALTSTNGAVTGLLSPLFANTATVVCGFAYRRISAIGAGAVFFTMYDGTAAADQCGLNHNADGSISAFRGTTANILGTSAAGLITVGSWHYIELEAVIDDSSGSMEVRVDGAAVLTVSAVDTKATANAFANRVRVWVTANTSSAFDDLYVLDTTGPKNNDFLGDSRVITLRPSSDASVTWGRSTGSTNYTLVDDVTYSATDYVVSSTAGEIDRYGLDNLPATPATVHAVMVNMVHQKTDSGARTIRSFVKSSATTENGATVSPVLNTDTLVRTLMENNPDTATAWTGSTVDALEAGVEVVT